MARTTAGWATADEGAWLRALPFSLGVAANAAALVVFACSLHGGDYPLAGLAIAAFLLVQVFLPACRPVWEAPLCPGNIAQAYFWVQLVLVPLLIGLSGIQQGTLPRVPSADAIHSGVLLRVLGYLAFCVAYQLSSRPTAPAPRRPALGTRAILWLAVAFLAVGVLGQVLMYQSFGEFLEWISSPAKERERAAEETTLATAAGTFLRPFLGFALVMIWSWWLSRAGRTRSLRASLVATALLVPLLLVSNFSYNRGSVLAPLLAVAAAFSMHVRRLSYPVVGLAAVLALGAALIFGYYRSTDLDVSQVGQADLGESWSEDYVAEFVQVYASGPQMAAFLMEEGSDEPLYWGRTLLCSVLYPVPVIGKPYREESGVAIFNMRIYQDPETIDQIIPYDAELYMNCHLVGVVAGYALLGWLVRFFQRRFLNAPLAIESYAWILLSLWFVFPGSLPVLSQICIYFFWPIYIYFAVAAGTALELPALLGGQPRRSAASPPAVEAVAS